MNKFAYHKNLKILLWLLISLCVFVIGLCSFPMTTAFAVDQTENYETFYSNLMQMYESYDDWDNEIVLQKDEFLFENNVAYIDEKIIDLYDLKKIDDQSRQGFFAVKSEKVKVKNDGVVLEKTPQNNRIIVVCEDKVDSCGAIMKAELDKFHIFQYTSAQEADRAFDFFNEAGLAVSYDYLISADASIEADASFTYSSWGSEYVGFGNYTESMVKIHSRDQLNQVAVAVIDSGINTSHKWFEGRILHQYGGNFTKEQSSTQYIYEDYKGHGTHVTGIIADATLDNVKFIPLKVLDKKGDGDVSMIIAAIEHLKQVKKQNPGLNIKTVNMSVGIRRTSTSVSTANGSLMNAVESLYDDGILPVVSAGNDRVDTSLACPANVEKAIVVSALKEDTNGRVVFDSSYSNFGEHVDFSAPGTEIYSAGLSTSGTVPMTGTSMAAPHVTAAVALIYSNPSYKAYTFAEVYGLLKNNAQDKGVVGWDKYYGWGCIDFNEIGVANVGYVSFSNSNKFPGNSFDLTLSYESSNFPQGTVEIYYSLSEAATFVDRKDLKYDPSKPINISKSTKVSAVAFVFNLGEIVQMSYVSSQVYYFDNIDLNSNFQFEETVDGKILKKYNGELTTLCVENGVTEIASSAFSDSDVEVLYLSSSVKLIDEYAFNRYSKLKEIYIKGKNVKVGKYAFYKCSNLNTFSGTSGETVGISEIGEYAFAYCTGLKKLYLPSVERMGNYSISASGIEELLIGKNIKVIGGQSSVKLKTVYGFIGTVCENFAKKNDANFVNIKLHIEKDLPLRRVEKQNETLILKATVVGFEVEADVKIEGGEATTVLTSKSVTGQKFAKEFSVELNNLSQTQYEISLNFKDAYQETISSEKVNLKIIDETAQNFTVSYDKNVFDIYVDGNSVEEIQLYQNQTYNFDIRSKNGFCISEVNFNGEKIFSSVGEDEQTSIAWQNGTNVLTIEGIVSAKEKLVVSFDLGGCSQVIVDDNVLQTSSQTVARGSDLRFKLQANEGYTIFGVYEDGKKLSADSEGFYTLKNVVTDLNVLVDFEQIYYDVKVVWGKGGSVSMVGELESKVAHGSSRTYTISTYEGYEIDFVTVNGKNVEVKNNKLTLDNVTESTEIFISFKKTNSPSQMLLSYFWILLSIFAVFIVARIILYFVRKNDKKN